jgi:hypothetical protein
MVRGLRLQLRTFALVAITAVCSSLLTGTAVAQYYQENMVNARNAMQNSIDWLNKASNDKGAQAERNQLSASGDPRDQPRHQLRELQPLKRRSDYQYVMADSKSPCRSSRVTSRGEFSKRRRCGKAPSVSAPVSDFV